MPPAEFSQAQLNTAEPSPAESVPAEPIPYQLSQALPNQAETAQPGLINHQSQICILFAEKHTL